MYFFWIHIRHNYRDNLKSHSLEVCLVRLLVVSNFVEIGLAIDGMTVLQNTQPKRHLDTLIITMSNNPAS